MAAGDIAPAAEAASAADLAAVASADRVPEASAVDRVPEALAGHIPAVLDRAEECTVGIGRRVVRFGIIRDRTTGTGTVTVRTGAGVSRSCCRSRRASVQSHGWSRCCCFKK